MPDERIAIRFESIRKEYAGGVRAVDDVTLDVPTGRFVVLLGPSGCGKTTLLKIINRLIEPTAGRMFVDGEDALAVDPVLLRRRIGYVIQQVGLFPHMTVAQNIAVVPSLLGWDAARTRARVDELLALVHLLPAPYRDRYPRQLSGGQQQRVGLARALAADPALLLMDEPFGAVDAIERTHLQDEMAGLHAQLHKTIVFVTHDVDEALRLAEDLVIMRDGRVVQAGAPLHVLAQPANDFVASLTGAGDVVRRFGVMRVKEAMSAAVGQSRPLQTTNAGSVQDTASLRAALSALLASTNGLVVVNESGAQVGTLGWDDLRRAARAR